MNENTQEPQTMSEEEKLRYEEFKAMGRVIFNIVNTITTRVIMPAKIRGADPRFTISALLDAAYVLSLVAAGDDEEEKQSLRDHLVMSLSGLMEDLVVGTMPLSYIHSMAENTKLSFQCKFQDVFDDQATFMKASGQSVGINSPAQISLYANLVEEESRELSEAVREFDQSPNRAEAEHVAKEACDVIVVAAGVLHSLGFNPGDAWLRVMGSNLSKIDPETKTVLKREDGKVLKGPNFEPANLSDLVWAEGEDTPAEPENVPVPQSETA